MTQATKRWQRRWSTWLRSSADSSASRSARGDDRFGLTVSYWETEDDARAWKQVAEHLAAQRSGQATWYERYQVRIASVSREYSWERGSGGART